MKPTRQTHRGSGGGLPARTRFLPQTVLGTWSGSLLVASVGFSAVFFGLAASGQTGGERFWDNLLLALPGLAAGVAAVAAGVLATLAVVRAHERSVTAYVAMTIGGILLFFLIGEFLAPH